MSFLEGRTALSQSDIDEMESVKEGTLVYNKDENELQIYTSEWKPCNYQTPIDRSYCLFLSNVTQTANGNLKWTVSQSSDTPITNNSSTGEWSVNTSGVYLVSCSATWRQSSGGERALSLRLYEDSTILVNVNDSLDYAETGYMNYGSASFTLPFYLSTGKTYKFYTQSFSNGTGAPNANACFAMISRFA